MYTSYVMFAEICHRIMAGLLHLHFNTSLLQDNRGFSSIKCGLVVFDERAYPRERLLSGKSAIVSRESTRRLISVAAVKRS